MNSTKVMAFSEIVNWIKYKSFKKEDVAQILCAVGKECLKVRGLTISQIISEGAKMMNKDEKKKDIKQAEK